MNYLLPLVLVSVFLCSCAPSAGNREKVDDGGQIDALEVTIGGRMSQNRSLNLAEYKIAKSLCLSLHTKSNEWEDKYLDKINDVMVSRNGCEDEKPISKVHTGVYTKDFRFVTDDSQFFYEEFNEESDPFNYLCNNIDYLDSSNIDTVPPIIQNSQRFGLTQYKVILGSDGNYRVQLGFAEKSSAFNYYVFNEVIELIIGNSESENDDGKILKMYTSKKCNVGSHNKVESSLYEIID